MSHARSTADRPSAARFRDAAFAAAALVAVALTGLTTAGARSWIDRPFAGFFLLADRTVPAVGRAGWLEVPGTRLYDRTVVAVNGVALADSDALHRRIEEEPVGSSFTYTVAGNGPTETLTIASRRFSTADYWAVFGAYHLTGLSYLLLAILAAWRLPANRLGRALLLVGSLAGLYMLSSADLYPPAASLRTHALTAALLPAAFLQFALVVGDARGRFATIALPMAWGASLATAASMQMLIGDPAAAGWVRATCDASLGLALAAATLGLIVAPARIGIESAPLLGCSALFGLGVPAAIFLLAGTHGGVPLNAGATLAFLFPLGVGASLLQDGIVPAADVARRNRSL